MPSQTPSTPATAATLPGVGFSPVNNQPHAVPITFEAITGVLTEGPGSPEINLGEHCTFTHTYTGAWLSGVAAIQYPGQYLADGDTVNGPNLFRVLSCNLKHRKGDRCIRTLVNEWVSGPIPPPDEFDVEPAEFNPSVDQNPIFVQTPVDEGIDPDALTLGDLSRARAAAQAPQVDARTANSFNPYAGEGSQAEDLFNKLVSLFRKGVETYYLAGFKITWSRYYFKLPPIDRGGCTQYPASNFTDDIVPSTFVRDENGILLIPDEGDFNGDNSFAYLRQADHATFSRTWFKVTRTWIGGPQGHWDNYIYRDDVNPSPVDGSIADWATDPGGY